MMNATTGRVLMNHGNGDWDEEVALFGTGASGLPGTHHPRSVEPPGPANSTSSNGMP